MFKRRPTAAEYLRRSTSKQEQSLDDQAKEGLKLASARGLNIVRRYQDDGFSGADADKRPGFQQLIRDAQSPDREWDYLICYDMSRFGRMDPDEKGHYRHLIKRAGVEIIYPGENLPAGPMAAVFTTIRDVDSNQYLVKLSRDVLRGMISAVQAGWWIGPPILGYDLLYFDRAGKPVMRVRHTESGQKHLLALDGTCIQTVPVGEPIIKGQDVHARLAPSSPERVALVRRIFGLALDIGPQSIAGVLNAEKVPSPRADWVSTIHKGVWTHSGIRSMLRNPAYIGDSRWNRTNVGKFHRVTEWCAVPKNDGPYGNRKDNPKEDWIIVKGTHKAIIDPDLFRRVNEILDARSKRWQERAFRAGRAKHSPFLLAGLLRCTRCGFPYYGAARFGYYWCAGYINGGNGTCKRTTFDKEIIEGRVIEVIKDRVARLMGSEGQRHVTRLVTENLIDFTKQGKGESVRLEGRRADLLKKVKQWRLIDESNRELVNADLAQLKAELSEIDTRLGDLKREQPKPPDPKAVGQLVVSHLGRFESLMKEGSLEDQKAFIRTLVAKIDLNPVDGTATLWLRPIPEGLHGNATSFHDAKGLRTLLEKTNATLEQHIVAVPGKLVGRGSFGADKPRGPTFVAP